MRMKQSRLKTLLLRAKIVTRDSEGADLVSWGTAAPVVCEVWPAGGKLQSEMYGVRINNIYNGRIRGQYAIETVNDHIVYNFGDFVIQEGDGICLYTSAMDNPDYNVISITAHNPLRLEMEKL